ncbi:MAG: MBL fold metallo-hydrolase [Pseudomonadota bacterium]|nr:MBL fold metallo-hydrolase [Pseudomonadota bacterium]
MNIIKTTMVVAVAMANAQALGQDFSQVQIKTTEVAEDIYMLEGAGGNLGLSVGADGAFLIDDQYAPLSEKISAAIANITDGDVRFLVNTHWHGDHTGGNENFGNAGAIIVAHDNVRTRMSTGQFREIFDQNIPASPTTALPIVTFADRTTFHWNGQRIIVKHVENAHTDGDSVVWFADADVFHLGDVFFNGFYPFVDVSSNGSLEGYISAVEGVLMRATEDTVIIPGHGPLANTNDLRIYLEVLRTARERIQSAIDGGMSEDEVVAAELMADYDEQWGGGFINPENFVRLSYKSLQ